MRTGSFISHLECSVCGEQVPHQTLQTTCLKCGKVLLARYNLAEARSSLRKNQLHGDTLWRYKAFLPLEFQENIVSLGEGGTPLVRLNRVRAELVNLYLKDESFNPTSSFKARGLCVAVSKAKELGATQLAIPSAGNAGSALAAYAAACGMEAHVFIPRDTPEANKKELALYGTHVTFVDGVISDAAKALHAFKERNGWFDVSTMKEPYRLEGKKTLGFELAEQFDWSLPDVVVYPAGGGTGLIGMWKAFEELETLGWINGKRPRMVAVQSSGCAPIVQAFEEGTSESAAWRDSQTIAAGLRVPKAFADYLILQVLRQSKGAAVAVSDQEIVEMMKTFARSEGIFMCPEGAATIVALKFLQQQGLISEQDRIVVFNTASGLKYLEVLDNQIHQ